MKRVMAALAFSITAVLPAACEQTADPVGETAPAAGATVAVPTAAAAEPPRPEAAESVAAAAAGAPSFAVLYPGAVLEDPGVVASGPAGPGGMVTYMTEAEPDAVIDFYRTRAEQAGLVSVMAMNQGRARAYGAAGHGAGPGAGTSLQVVASPAEAGRTSVQLSWSAGG